MEFTRLSNRLSFQRKLALNLWLAISYVLAANVGLLFLNFNASSSPVWPPSGLSLAIALVFGFRYVMPGIILGSLLTSYLVDMPLVTTLGTLIANLLGPTLATFLIQVLNNGKFSLRRPYDVCCFIIFGAFFAPFLSNLVHVFSYYSGGIIILPRVPVLWQEWFLGDALGVLLFTPFTLSFFQKRARKYNIHEALVLFFLLALSTYWALEGEGVRKFIFIPFLTWAALRFSYRGVSMTAALVVGIAVWRSTVLKGVFDHSSPEFDLLWIQLFGIGMAIMGFFLATVVEADNRAEEKEMELSINLRHKEFAEEALAVLDQVLNKSPTGFAIIDRGFRFIRINETLAELNGIPAQFHLGKHVRDILPNYAAAIEECVSKVLATENSIMNTPFSMPSPKNAKVTVRGVISYYPIKHPTSKEILGVGVSLQDLTAQLQTERLLEENQERLNFAQEAGQIGAFEWDIRSNKLIVSPQVEMIYGLEIGDLKSYHELTRWIHPEDLEGVLSELQKVISKGHEFSIQFRIITKCRKLKWIMTRGKMLRDPLGLDLKMIGINIDITDQKDIEQKLRLTEANLLHALSTRDEFMAIASHELKTPLTSLKLQNQLYQRTLLKNETISTEKVATLLEKNSRQIDRLTRLVDDMLDISRIRTGKLTVKKELCELSTILNDVLLRTKEQFLTSGSGEPIIEQLDKITGEWDVLRLEQVFLNIITNAIRYGQGRPITISIKNYPEHAQICVKDQGLGVAKSDIEKIFQRYERGLLAREVSGLGLGLFISQQIVEAHGGKIWVESELNKGASFFVSIPKLSLVEMNNPAYEGLIQAGS